MPRLDLRNPPPAIYNMVVEPRPAGRVIGTYRDQPIAEKVVDHFGRRFTYVGVLERTRAGVFDLSGLRTGEFIVEPGLIYRMEEAHLPNRRGLGRDHVPFSGPQTTPRRGEHTRVAAQIGGALALFLTGVLAVQFVLTALHAG